MLIVVGLLVDIRRRGMRRSHDTEAMISGEGTSISEKRRAICQTFVRGHDSWWDVQYEQLGVRLGESFNDIFLLLTRT